MRQAPFVPGSLRGPIETTWRSARPGLLALACAAIAMLLAVGARGAATATCPCALQFNGSSQYVTFGPAPALGAAQFTLETWFNRSGPGVGTSTGNLGIASAIPLVTKGRAEAEASNVDMNYFLGIDASSGKLVADFEEGAGQPTPGLNHPVSGNTVITSGAWHHAAATYDGHTWKLYLDGKLDGSLTVSSPATISPRSDSIQHAGLGTAMTSTGAAAGFFQGTMDEARIWNVARTGAQIRASKDAEIASPTTGLIGRWGLEQGSGTTATDSSGNNVTGTLVNAPTWTSGYTFPQDSTAPATVQGLTAAPGDQSVALTWTANSESDLAGYNVYRSLSTPVSTAGTPLNGADLLRTTSYADSGLVNGQLYHYAVVAVDGSNNSSTPVEVAATPSSGVVTQNALQLDGSSQYVTFGQASALGVTQFTLETWFRRSGAGVGTSTGTLGLANAIPLVAKGRAEAETPANLNMNYFLGIDATSGVLVGDFEDTVNGTNHPVSGATSIAADNVWHHAAATYDGTTWRLYLDGKLDAKSVVGAFTPESTSIQHASLGSALNSTGVAAGFFQGTLDDAQVWGVARTGDAIRSTKNSPLSGSPSGLKAHWALDETSGTTASDSSGNNVNGTIVGGGTHVPGYTFPQDSTAPAAPQGFTATGGNAQVTLNWTAGTESDLAGYNLYRSTTSPVATTGTPVNGGDLLTGTSYTDTSVTNGQKYYYVLVAVDGSNNASTASSEANATPASAPADPVLAGDIADCTRTQDQSTADLIAGIPGHVFTIGDNAYDNGTAAEFANCYDPTWGAFKDRTRPTLGNHDFGNGTNPGAPNYYDYFNGVGNNDGPAGPRGKGYYSYEVTGNGVDWHVVVLNSECEPSTGYWLPGGCAAGSAQDLWLKADLANSPTNNIIAMWHKPRFSSSASYPHMQQLWSDLYAGGADIVLAGHEHDYERFAQMDANGNADPAYGVRAFTVGTGGEAVGGFGTILPTSEARSGVTNGVIKFTLHANSYDWQFIPIAGETFTDSGTTAVHGPPPDTTAPSVTIDSVVPSTLNSADTSTTVTFHATENGTYEVRVGGTDCTTGSVTDSGSYSGTPATATSVVPASALAEGANTLRVCVTDASSNTGSATTTVTKDSTQGPGIAFRSSSSGQNGLAGSSLTLPVPAGVVSGDVLVAVVDVIAAPVVTAPAGWTLVRSDVTTAANAQTLQSAYVHVVGGSEPSSYVWSFGSKKGAAGAILAYSGVDTASPVDASSGLAAAAKSTSITAPSVTASVAGDMLVGLYEMQAQHTITPPSSLTERTEIVQATGNGQRLTSETADQSLASAGATGTRVATADSSGYGIGQLIALRPAGA